MNCTQHIFIKMALLLLCQSNLWDVTRDHNFFFISFNQEGKAVLDGARWLDGGVRLGVGLNLTVSLPIDCW